MEKNIAIVGCGYWGKNLVRTFYQLGVLKTVCDQDINALETMRQQYSEIEITTEFSDLLNNPAIKGIVIAAPANLHYILAKKALLAGKDIFVEKPLALESNQGQELVELAKERQQIIMVGHILNYHSAIIKLKALVAQGALGKVNYIYSNRLNFGKIRSEENTLWSFAPHDISVILGLINEMPIQVRATGASYLNANIADTTMSQLTFSNGVRAHIYVSWLHPFKEQKLVIVGEKQMAVFDDAKSWNEKLTLYPHEVVWVNGMPQAKKAEGVPVEIEAIEPLKAECTHFINCLSDRSQATTDGDEGLRGLKVLNALQQSQDHDGAIIKLQQGAGDGCFVHDTAVIDQNVTIGNKTKIWHFSHVLPNTVIGENCSFGQNCVVGPNVVIGNHVKVQNNVCVYDGVEIEDDVFLGPSMVFTNITNPRSFHNRQQQFKRTVLKKGCSIGANATIICGITIGQYAFVGAGSVVTKDIPAYALVYGSPGKQHGWVSKLGNKLIFDEQGRASDPEDGSKYQLKDNNVWLMSEEEVGVKQ